NITLLSLSNKGDLLALQNDQLVLYSIEKNELNPLVLNSLFKEGGVLQNFALTLKEDRIFFTRKTQDKSIFAKLAKKEVIIQELAILNLTTKKEEIFLTKKAEKEEDLYLFKLSPFANHILVADPKNMTIHQINLLNYSEELSFSIDNVEIVDFFVNNEGDSAFILKEENKKGIYFIGKNSSKAIIKTEIDLENYTIINFNPLYYILKHKNYPEIVIIDKHGTKYLNFLSTDIDNAGYPFWAIVFPNYEDIIVIYIKQFKLPAEILFYNYSNIKYEFTRIKAKEKKQELKQESFLESVFSDKTQILKEKEEKIETSHIKEEYQEKVEQQEQFEQKETERQVIFKPITDESIINKKILEEVKSQAQEVKYDPSSFLKFLEESEAEKENNKENNKEVNIPKTKEEMFLKPSKIKLEEIPDIKTENVSQKLSEIKLEIPQTPPQKEFSSTSKIEKSLETEKTIEINKTTPEKTDKIDLENILSKLESKLEKGQKESQIQLAEETLSNEEELTIQLKKQITPEDIEKLEKEKNEIINQINELKFLKNLGEISPEEYENKMNKLKQKLQEIKEKIEKIKSS
ncbi:MAG: hypothetical protein ACK4GR_04260, partial [bacterium]